MKTSETLQENGPTTLERPVRTAARKGKEWMKEWVTALRGHPEDVMDSV